MLCEVLPNSSEFEPMIDSNSEDDINQLLDANENNFSHSSSD